MLSQQAWADDDDPSVTLDAMTVTLNRQPTEQLGETITTRKELDTQNIQNAQDLVRYNTEVDVAEVGRYGNKGFAIRGVDGNRVAMNIDGVALPEVESNELFSPYGYIYEGRFNPDLEMMGGVRIAAGADSLLSGSGAVGGSVSYRTKEPASMVKGDGNLGGYAKVGYTTKNEELLTAAGLAGVWDKAEFLLNYSHRKGHELKNHGMRSYNKEREYNINYDFAGNGELGRASQPQSAFYPDSLTYKRDAVLGKFYYHLNDEHRIGAQAIYQKTKTHSYAYSKSSSAGYRMPDDVEELKSYGLNYRFTPQNSSWLNSLDAKYQYHDVLGLADTWVYSGHPTRILSRREYRPTETQTHQFRLDGKLNPIDFGKLGSHQITASAIYNKQDFKQTNVSVGYNSAGEISWATQPYIMVFPDAKKDQLSFILSDDIQFNDRFNAKLGLRYDHHTVAPYFQNDTYFGDEQSNEQNEIAKNINSSTKFYTDYRAGVYHQKPKFDKLTYSGLFDYELIRDKLTARYKVGTGFLAPNVTQMYSAFQGMGVMQIVNPSLKPETSVNHELELEFKPDDVWTLTGSVYQSDYKNFIYTSYWDRWDNRAKSNKWSCNSGSTCILSENLNDAQIKGYKLGVRADVSKYLGTNDRMYLTLDYHKSKDKAKVVADQEADGILEINTLAAVPSSTILGVDYHFGNDDKASLHFKAKFTEAKRADETKYVKAVSDRSRASGYREEVATYDHLNRLKDTWVFDVYGNYKIAKNLTLQAGIYNLTDLRYYPWENMRQFGNNPSINNFVDYSSTRGGAGHGFNRYTAPGRNYALSLTYEF
ncbi:MAG: TonB-dependent hemoglobin/transferrin/lactoferrin family receptor [Moraxella sp.]|nr:TonB-dependent hemoglobin/transferrin/lactoferrin family receptor [Moraxella sp.]